MPNNVLQFGAKPSGNYRNRTGAYAVVFNKNGEILVLRVHDSIHLPGGGIDEGEDPKVAVVREAHEEAGCEIGGLRYLGKANQYLQKAGKESMNKLGTFYLAELMKIYSDDSSEDDHIVSWLKPEDFLKSNASEAAKWAIEQSLKLRIKI